MRHQLISENIKNKNILACVFDMDGTLYSSSACVEQQIKPSMIKTASTMLGLSEEASTNLLRKYRSQFKSSILGLEKFHNINPFEFYDTVYGNIDISKVEPYRGFSTALKELSRKCPTFVLTNSNRSFAKKVLSTLGIEDVFRKIFTVEDNGFIRKPNKEVYDSLFKDKLELDPKQVLIFDDIASSQKVAAAFGATTILVGNGLRPEPKFVDLHTNIEYSGKPKFLFDATHNICEYINKINHHLS